MQNSSTTQLLVTGASGHLGQSALFHLLETLKVPAQRIVATTRTPGSLASWAARGVEVRAADFGDESSLDHAFGGADRMLLISTDADMSGQRLQQHRRAIEAAERAGVSHLTYTSMPEPQRSLVLFAPDHAQTEAALDASKLPNWTVLRNHWYFENVLMLVPGVLARGGKWFSAAGDGKLADTARDDVAFAAACELAGPSLGKATYTISGAQALTTAEQVQLIGDALGKPIQVIPVSPQELTSGLVGAGVPQPFAQLLASFDANAAAGFMGEVTGDFQKITGRQPQSFAHWLTLNRAALSGT